ncbi:hypothetical protein GIB67_013938 [Kingdonia uniflora]|uniref:DIS3-like exonuclease 2 n=1 Tax=Kingdonia uniflora TaxID=39325 RepID=A0A7J7LDE9_9MAGN|nr:hypothetical protein GIB67_013938 [Kingdonia uniflora]
MSAMTEQIVVEELSKDKKKKQRRSSRRSKQTSPNSGVSYSCVNENGRCVEASTECFSNYVTLPSAENSSSLQSPRANLAFSSLPTMHIYGDAPNLGKEGDSSSFPSVSAKVLYLNSCPLPITHNQTNGSLGFSSIETDFCVNKQTRYFTPHWSDETVSKALEGGEVFRASFRVNAYNQLEAYCTIDGVPTDILINGVASQNRAVEGDVVAVQLDPDEMWTKLKGSAVQLNNPSSMNDSNVLPEVVELDGVNKAVSNSLGKICSVIKSYPLKRPTGKVVAIVKRSSRRDSVVGFLSFKDDISYKEGYQKDTMKSKNLMSGTNRKFIKFVPNDAKLPRMLVSVENLPDYINKRLKGGDSTVEMELVGAQIYQWKEESLVPLARIIHIFGRGGEIEPQSASILFENAIRSSEFSPNMLSCLPDIPWEVPMEELGRRKDLRNLCTFTIDPATATDLDDALSVERVSSNVFKIGVHIADASFFILPDTALDIEARTRSTSVYLRQHKIPMLPSLFSEDLGSLIPGVDRLAISIVFDLNLEGEVLDRWIGHTVIRSCCQLSHRHAQDIIEQRESMDSSAFPKVYNRFGLQDVIGSVRSLYEISKILKENRTKDGALCLESSKLFLLFDECGVPYDSMFHLQTESDFLVEEFMLLANRTVAEVISRAFPDSALLRRHPEPKPRKLKDFEAFCSKHGLKLNTSSSSQLNLSLEKLRENLMEDPVFFDILLSYASKLMQLASYFCTGEFKGKENECAHYSLAVPFYTHFTSPLRRYPDVVVHRTLAAVIEAEDIYLKVERGNSALTKYFTGLKFHKDIIESKGFREALSAASLKHRVPSMDVVANIAAYCNERRLATRRAEDASGKLYLWILLKKKKTLITQARVLGLGPRFMSIYIPKLAMERRIQYDEVHGLTVEWLDSTSTLVLDFSTEKRSQRRGYSSENCSLDDVALVVNPCDLKMKEIGSIDKPGISHISDVDPPVFPLTVQILSSISVALHAIGGEDGPLDMGVRLYMGSYLK